MQIFDRRTIAIPGPMGDVTPAALEARDDALAAQQGAEAARDVAETFAAGTVALQDEAIAANMRATASLTRAATAETVAEMLDAPGSLVHGAADGAVSGLAEDASSRTSAAVAASLRDKDAARGIWFAAIEARNNRPVVLGAAGSSSIFGANGIFESWIPKFSKRLQNAYPLVRPNSPVGLSQPSFKRLATALSTGITQPGLQIVNAGLGSTNSSNYLTSETRAQLAGLNPDVIFHQVGSGDFHQGIDPEVYKDNVRMQIDGLDAGSSRPILHILIHAFERPQVDWTPMHPWSAYGRALAELAAEDQGRRLLVDLSGKFTAMGLPWDDRYGLISDGVHLNPQGDTIMAELMADALGVPGPAANLQLQVAGSQPFTSDNFEGSGNIVTTNGYFGGASGIAYSGSGWTRVSGEAVSASGTSLAMVQTTKNMGHQVSAVITSLPAGTGIVRLVVAARSASTSANRYAADVVGDGRITLSKVVGGTTTVFDTVSMPTSIQGRTVSIRQYWNYVSLLVDGVELITVYDTEVGWGGWAGLIANSADTRITSLRVDELY